MVIFMVIFLYNHLSFLGSIFLKGYNIQNCCYKEISVYSCKQSAKEMSECHNVEANSTKDKCIVYTVLLFYFPLVGL